MAQSNKAGMWNLINKRDKVFDQMEFNEKYPEVYASLLDEKNNKQLQRLDIEAKKRLLPLEVAATPAREANKWLLETGMEPLKQKQVNKRREIQQTYLRGVEKMGEAQAAAARDAQLAILDKELADRAKELEQKYPQNLQTPADGAAVAKYEAATKEEEARLEVEKKRLNADKEQKLGGVAAKLEKKNKKLKVTFDEANKKLYGYSKIGRQAEK